MRLPLPRRFLAIALAAALPALAAGCDRASDGVVEVVVIDGKPQLVDPQRGELTPS